MIFILATNDYESHLSYSQMLQQPHRTTLSLCISLNTQKKEQRGRKKDTWTDVYSLLACEAETMKAIPVEVSEQQVCKLQIST